MINTEQKIKIGEGENPLLPCPFCSYGGNLSRYVEKGYNIIQCPKCGAQVANYEHLPVDEWNMRGEAERLAERVEFGDSYVNITNDCLAQQLRQAEIGTLVGFIFDEEECGNPDHYEECDCRQSVGMKYEDGVIIITVSQPVKETTQDKINSLSERIAELEKVLAFVIDENNQCGYIPDARIVDEIKSVLEEKK